MLQASFNQIQQIIAEKHPDYAERHNRPDFQYHNLQKYGATQIIIKKTVQALNWYILAHPLYSPDVDRSDYYFFFHSEHQFAREV